MWRGKGELCGWGQSGATPLGCLGNSLLRYTEYPECIRAAVKREKREEIRWNNVAQTGLLTT